ncbi:hypothetical protein CYMTET_20354 [Cymbomonas tetramitiformis]|uniref:Glycoside hydrolase family 31 TIM barrel domain-containing protein n=1 Tax=Cymbomonas tetramitiformis TaxID=36881 RepID=A0AAE0G482_9CHLO|nr:hypothetical protein CYMTET_20354 [Cymbomonas tetramitiformis]
MGLLKALAPIVLAYGVFLYQQRNAVPAPHIPGQLHSSLSDTRVFRLADFVVTYDGQDAQVRVHSKDNLQDPVWQTIPGEEFLLVAQTVWNVFEKHGSFDVKETTASCSGQAIDRVDLQGGSVRLSGVLHGCEPPLRYMFTIVQSNSSSSPSQLAISVRLCGLSDELDCNVAKPSTGPWTRVLLAFSSTEDEGFYGFGHQYSLVDLKGTRLPILTNEQGVLRETPFLGTLLNTYLQSPSSGTWHSTYTCIPQYVSSNNYSLFIDNTEFVVFDMRDSKRVVIELNATSLSAGILYARTPLQLIEEYTAVTGRMRGLPNWLLDGGAVVGMQGGSEVVLEKMRMLEKHGCPIAGIWLQDWVGKRHLRGLSRLWWNWELDESYSDWPSLVTDLNGRGIQLLTYVNPHLTDVSTKPSFTRNMYKEALDAGYLMRHCSGELVHLGSFGFDAGIVDLSNPAAFEWMKDVVRSQLRIGARGWMADFGEAVPFDACLHNGTGVEWHNRYPVEWARLNAEVVREEGLEDEVMFFTRAAGQGSARHTTLQWLGDQMTTWDAFDGIATVVPGALSGGFSGIAMTHSDIGGYTNMQLGPWKIAAREKELLMRWCELSAFEPVYRSHEGCIPSLNVHPWTDDDTAITFTVFAKVHLAWAPYKRQLVEEAVAQGRPVMRHMWLMFPQHKAARDVTTQGAGKVKVYFPRGCWVQVEFRPVAGEAGLLCAADDDVVREVAAPLGHPAVFFPQGSAVGAAFQARVSAIFTDHAADLTAMYERLR